MAKIKYLLQSKSDNAPIYLRLSLSQNRSIKRRTGLHIHPKFWSKSRGLPKQNDSHNKNVTSELIGLSAQIMKDLNNANTVGVEVDGQWLVERINLHFDRVKEKAEKNSLVEQIDRIIEFADTKVLRGGKIGLSRNRIKGYTTFKGVIKAFQDHIGREIQLHEIDQKFEEEFRNWLLKSKGYSVNYAGKNFDNLKAICSEAERLGKKVHPHAKNIRSFSERKEDRNVITLSFDELETIERLRNLPSHLENTRKWLLLGCEIGQRGGDLLRITGSNFNERDGHLFLDIKQQKTGKEVSLVVKPSIQEMLESGLPHRISIQKFNNYLKDLCERAGIDAPTKGKLYDKEKKRKISKHYPKFKLITSHICRRSFATNYYKQVPTPLLMIATGHSKESLFLDYIGEKEDKDADAKLMFKYAMHYEEKRKKEKHQTPKMKAVK